MNQSPTRKTKRKKPRFQLLQAIQFSEGLRNVRLWIEKAEDLFVAAQILEREVVKYWEEIRFEGTRLVREPGRKLVQGPYFLIVAYALENYFKALLIHRNRESLRNRVLTNIPDYIKSHDLLGLVKLIGIKATTPEEELLFRLSENSVWKARYPVPIGPKGMVSSQKLSDGRSYLTAYFGPKDVHKLQKFVKHCRELVEQEIGISQREDA